MRWADVATILLSLGHAVAQAPPASFVHRASPLLGSVVGAARAAKSSTLRGCAARSLELIAKALCNAAGAKEAADGVGAGSAGGVGFVVRGGEGSSTRDEAVQQLLRFLTTSLRGAYGHKQQLVEARRVQLPALHACAMFVTLPPMIPPQMGGTPHSGCSNPGDSRRCRAPWELSHTYKSVRPLLWTGSLLHGLLQLMQADVLAAKSQPAPQQPTAAERGGGAEGSSGGRMAAAVAVDLAAVAEETYRHRQLMGVAHAVLAAFVAPRGPPPFGLLPLLAAVLPLGLSSYPLLRFRAMEAVRATRARAGAAEPYTRPATDTVRAAAQLAPAAPRNVHRRRDCSSASLRL